jgi:hypothetical protein
MEHQWNETDRGKPKYSGKNLSQCTLSTTNPTRTDRVLNLGLCGGREVANHLSHGTATGVELYDLLNTFSYLYRFKWVISS